MRRVLDISRKINNFFIKSVLFVFYFVVVGLVSLVYRLSKLRKKAVDSYWITPDDQKQDIDYLSSPY